MPKLKTRVRFAPSPSGNLHLGNARTALFNWLFAKKNNGEFILRIEDTDSSRSSEEHSQALMDILDWLNLVPNESPNHGGDYGPYKQSERKNIYQKIIKIMIQEKKAFWSPSEMGTVKRFDQEWRDECLSKEEAEKIGPSALRFKSARDNKVEINDLLKGKIKVNTKQIGDFVIARNDLNPLYNFACVVDDHLMEISHVIRGEDHLTNTAKQIQIYKTLGWEPPKFIHLPLVMGPDGSPLSKRHGDVSVEKFKEQGFLPESIINSLAMLGWGPGDDREIFSKEEISELFKVEKLNISPSKFFPKKLQWFNGQHIRRLKKEKLKKISIKKLREKNIEIGEADLSKLIDLVQDRLRNLNDIVPMIGFFFKKPDLQIVLKNLKNFDTKSEKKLKELLVEIEKIKNWSKGNLEEKLEKWRSQNDYHPKEIWQPLRIVLSGEKVSPPIFDTLELLGKEEVSSRLEKTIELF